MLKRVSAVAFAVSATTRVEASKFPKVSERGVSYLRSISFFEDYSSIQTGMGGSVTPIELHDTLATVDMTAGGETFGPKGVSGHDLAALNAILRGQQPSENVDAEGDEAVGASANVERQILEQFRYDLIGAEPGDFAPPIAYLAELGGALEFTTSARPANASADPAGTISVYVDTDESPELHAVPPVRFVRNGLNALTNGSLPGGRLHALLLKRTSDITDSLVDLWQLYADGAVISDMGDPSWINQLVGFVGNAVAASGANWQESGMDAQSGTRPRFLQLYPHRRYAEDRRLTKRATANQFTYNITSGLTASQFFLLTLLSTRLTPAAVVDQVAPAGVMSRSDIVRTIQGNPAKSTKPKTRTKVGTVSDRHQGWLPIKVNVPSDKFGLRGR